MKTIKCSDCKREFNIENDLVMKVCPCGNMLENDDGRCVLCGTKIEGFGHNAMPLDEGRCCDDCNVKVIIERVGRFAQ